MSLKVTLIKSYASADERQCATVWGLGLRKFGDTRILKDTPSIRGMAKKVQHLVKLEEVKDAVVARARFKPRHVRAREMARARAAKEGGTKS